MSEAIWVAGEVLIDLIPRGAERVAIVGGGPANTAKALARLGFDSFFIDGFQPINMVNKHAPNSWQMASNLITRSHLVIPPV